MRDESTYPRRRSRRAHDAILAATLDLVQEKGYFGLSMEAVAARAGVGKQTIYRWWRSKAVLVMEALAVEVASQVQVPDTGTVRDDLRLLLETIVTRMSLSGSGKAMAGLIAEAQADPEFAAAFRSDFIEPRREGVRTILRRGVARGELDPETEIEVAVDAVFGPMWYRLLMQHAPLDGEFARNLARQVVEGIAPRRG